MKTIGLIGGMSWESTVSYYQRINQQVKQRLGGLHSAQVILYSVDFHYIEQLQQQGAWGKAGALLAQAAQRLELAGADCIVLCTNTMHKVAPMIVAAVQIPLLHIADPTAWAIRAAGIKRVGLLGTRFTMEQDFYRGRLETEHRLQVLIPDLAERELVHQVIYAELCLGSIRDESRRQYQQVIAALMVQGAEGIILGCTEIALLLSAADVEIPIFDTTALHADYAVEFALSSDASVAQ